MNTPIREYVEAIMGIAMIAALVVAALVVW